MIGAIDRYRIIENVLISVVYMLIISSALRTQTANAFNRISKAVSRSIASSQVAAFGFRQDQGKT